MPEDLAVQMPVLKEVLDALNIPCYELAGWEADDLIGTITRQCEQAGWDCRVATGDRDALQLVSDQTYVELVTTRMGQTTTQEMDPAAFREKYGFAPGPDGGPEGPHGGCLRQRPRGARGGEKTALALLRDNGTLAEVYARLDQETLETRPVMKKRLAEGRESAFLSYDLCTIRRDAPWTSPRRRRAETGQHRPARWSCSRSWTSKNSSPRWGWTSREPARPTSLPHPPKRWCG